LTKSLNCIWNVTIGNDEDDDDDNVVVVGVSLVVSVVCRNRGSCWCWCYMQLRPLLHNRSMIASEQVFAIHWM